MKFLTVMGIIFTIVGAFFLFQVLQAPHQPANQSGVDVMREAAPILALVFLPMGLIFTAIAGCSSPDQPAIARSSSSRVSPARRPSWRPRRRACT